MNVFLKICGSPTSYKDEQCVEDVCNYIGNKGFAVYGQGCSSNVNVAISEFQQVSEFYDSKVSRYLFHFVLSFKKSYQLTNGFVLRFADYAARYFSSEYQVLYSIQNDNGHTHIHFVVNTTSYVTGKGLIRSPKEKSRYMEYLNCFSNIEVSSNNYY